ncbi:hypothetical protein PVK06_043798 [Gossypium arboreum]|uniref:CCHC-type domain-containing protein n=1 Tax=Gossypium arboreum TaxID=29729 RepID=A0ABR0MPC2_GOSAR|nr:hypothetical protein PVK06_043798 [Gossypium arboreum]
MPKVTFFSAKKKRYRGTEAVRACQCKGASDGGAVGCCGAKQMGLGPKLGLIVSKLYFNIDSRARGRFARITVYVRLDKPSLLQILINETLQRIKYECLPAICFSCGYYGHRKDLCSSKVNNLGPGSKGKPIDGGRIRRH